LASLLKPNNDAVHINYVAHINDAAHSNDTVHTKLPIHLPLRFAIVILAKLSPTR